jgi:type 1 glutamine amidotransferase
MKRRKVVGLAVAALLGAGALGVGARVSCAAPPDVDRPVPHDQIQKIESALPAEAPAKPQKPRKVLVFTLASGFVHSSIPTGAKTFELMGKKLGTWDTVISHDKEMFQPDKLNEFDAVIMESTTGELFGLKRGDYKKMNDEEKAHNDALRQSLVDYVKLGHGLVGVHAAGDCSYDWPEYGEMIGGYFNGHPWQHVTYKIDDPSSPLTAMFPKNGFELSDETYTYKKEPYSRSKLHVLASIDTSKMSDADKAHENRPYDHDYALAWVHQYGKGRVFYAAHGHREEIYWNPVMLKFYLAGIQYALGDLQANDAPSASGTASAK